MKQLKTLFIIFILLYFPCTAFAAEGYTVAFEGVDSDLLELLRGTSQLIALQDSPPTTDIGLRRRAESDINHIVDVLHSLAFYNARVSIDYDFQSAPAAVKVHIETGPVYPIEALTILPDPASSETYPYECLPLEEIGISIGEPAFAETILSAEKNLEEAMHQKGYPYARVTNREVTANQSAKSISIILFVDSGPIVRLGKTAISGNKRVKESFFKNKLSWHEGQIYSPQLLQQTQNELEMSNLFSSVNISLPETPSEEEGDIPVTIEVSESKPRSIGLGVNYETNRGPGFTADWEHRNLTGSGDKLSLKGDIWYDQQSGRMSYIIPDYGVKGQKLIWSADYLREIVTGYHEKSYSLGATLSRQIAGGFELDYGWMVQHLINTDIHELKHHQRQKWDGETFNLVKCPISFYRDSSNSILDPTSGYRIKLRATPSYNFTGKQLFYDTHLCTFSYYHPFDSSHRHVLAGQATFGAILGPQKDLIPRSELFDAGTDTLLRGYKYKSVSPLDNTCKPTGGRSMLIYSLEYRYRQTNDFGWVLFWDFGGVYANRLPDLKDPLLHSAGVGLRYFTPIGPIRLDVAVPLNKRRHVDKSSYQVYFGFGQTF